MSEPRVAPSEEPSFGPSALLTPANAVTIARLLLAPVAFVWIVEEQSGWWLWALWALLTTTDSLDGFLARRHGSTRSGAFLDPLADKVLSLGGLWAMVLQGRFWWLPVVLLSAREAAISAYRAWWGRRGLAVPASQIAKFKTFLMFGAVGWVVFPVTADVDALADTFLWAAVGVAWVSAFQYVRAGRAATSVHGRR